MSDDLPLVSIVINNHDYERYLAEAIDSALAQTYPRVEVIVVDDGSTDGSRALIARYGDRVRPVLKPNGGQASALNAGFAASRGDVVLFLDADDALEPDAAAEVARAWRPGVAKVQFRLAEVDEHGEPTGRALPGDALPSGDLSGAVLRHGRYAAPSTSGNAFARATLEALMPVPEQAWRLLADTYLITLSAFFGEIVSLDRTLGRMRAHGANQWTMSRVRADRLREHLEYDERKEYALAELTRARGLELPADWRLREPRHVQSRLASLRLEPERHPHPGDRPWPLAWRGVRASWREPSYSLRKRLFFSLWFLGVAALPRPLAARLIAAGYVARGRPRWLQALVR